MESISYGVQDTQKRVIIKKIYVWRAVLFGLLYGAISGIIFGVLLFILVLLGINELAAGGLPPAFDFATLGTLSFISIGVIVIIYTLFCGFFALVSAFVYNLAAKIRAGVHVGLEEYKYVGS